MASPPEVAVVVGAYGREEFVLDAVRSVLEQSVGRGRVELLVTKNFRSPAIDGALERAGVASRFDERERIGTWLLAAVRATHAPIVTLLDDDDRYAPERLARVLEVFRAHPEVGFYRNRVEVVDAAGAPASEESWRPKGLDPYFDDHGPILIRPGEKQGLVDLLFHRTRVSFNSSTMAFRRELLDGRRGEWFGTTRLPDSSLLLNAVVSPFGLYLDDRRLTRHRLHPRNVTRRVGWLDWAAESYGGFAAEADEFHRPDFSAYYLRMATHYERMSRAGAMVARVGAGAPRRDLLRDAAGYARFLARHPEEWGLSADVWAPEAYAVAGLISPGLAQRVQRTRPSGQDPGVPASGG